MESIDHFINQQKLMLQMEKNNLGHLQTEQSEKVHAANGNVLTAKFVDDNKSVDRDNDEDLELQRVLLLEKDTKDEQNRSLSNDSDRGKKHFGEQYEMDQPSDKFYANFSDQTRHKQELAHSRHQEYQEYLSRVATKESLEHKRKANSNLQYHHDQELQKNQLQREVNQQHQKQDHDHEENLAQLQHDREPKENDRDNRGVEAHDTATSSSPRLHQELHEYLRHTNFSGSNSNPNAVHDRNQEQAQVAARKKMEYQRDLMKQIEDKKLELKALRERDRIEDEKLTKRLQEQLQAIHLEDALQKERARTEQVRINNEHNHIRRMHLLSKLENDHKLYNPYAERKARSENGINQVHAAILPAPPNSSGAKVYKYFSTSARYPPAPTVPNRTKLFLDSGEEDDFGPPPAVPALPSAAIVQYCRRCHNDLVQPVCTFCERKRHNLPINRDNCLKCSVALTVPVDRAAGLCTFCRQTNLRCGYCQKHIEVCPNCDAVFCIRCHRRRQQYDQENEENVRPPKAALMANVDDRPIVAARPASPYLRPSKNNPYRSFNIYSSDSEQDLSAGHSVVVRQDNKVPYSTNVQRTSIFHPNRTVEEPKLTVGIKNGQIFVEDLDERLAKYARNYGELRRKHSLTKASSYNDDSYPLPLMPAVVSVAKGEPKATPVSKQPQDSPAVKMLQRKWEIPAVQKHLLSDNPELKPSKHRVLTQLGAIRKQLQLEKMELDQTMLNQRQ